MIERKPLNLVIVIESELSVSKKKIENQSEEEKEIEKPNKIINIVEKINDRT